MVTDRRILDKQIRDTIKQTRLGVGTRQTTSPIATLQQQDTGWFERQLVTSQFVGEFRLADEVKLDVREPLLYAGVFAFHQKLVGLRRSLAPLRASSGTHVFHLNEGGNVLAFRRTDGAGNIYLEAAAGVTAFILAGRYFEASAPWSDVTAEDRSLPLPGLPLARARSSSSPVTGSLATLSIAATSASRP